MTKQLRILYLEDSPQDAEFALRILRNAGIDFTFKLVDKKEAYREALKEYQPDVVLADHSLVRFDSADALKIFKATGMKMPFILVTGTVSEEFAVNILNQGADDYLLKNNLSRLPNAILNSLEKYRLERERQEHLDRIIASEALLKEAEQLANFGSWEADVSTGEVKWSDGIFRLFGYEPEEIKPGHDIILHHIHPDDRKLYQRIVFSGFSENDNYGSDIRVTDKNSADKFVYFKVVVKRNNKGRLTRLLGFMQNVTEKRRLERELAEQTLRQQKLITEVTIEAQEKERNEIGRELHDNVNQILASVKIFLDVVMRSEDNREELIRRSNENVTFAIEEIRKLSRSLVSPSLGDIGLVNALQELAEEVNFSKEMKVEVIAEIGDGKNINKNVELTLYRIAQEQLNNIYKYAKAQKVIINIRTEKDNLLFSITDNGVGFDTTQKAAGIGLKNIKSRVSFYSGSMNLISSPGKGCTLSITIPFK